MLPHIGRGVWFGARASGGASRSECGSEAGERRVASLAVVSESFARSVWPGEDPIGKVLHQPDKSAWQVVGMARDAEVGELGDANKSFVYLTPSREEQWMMQTMMVHYDGDFAAASNALRAVTKEQDPALKVDIARLEDNPGPYRTVSRLMAEAAGVLGFLALGLAMIGLYGTVAYGAIAAHARLVSVLRWARNPATCSHC